MSARAGRRGRRGLRREAPILMPAALALFAMLGVTTLVSYRVAVERFALERQEEALALAERSAEALAATPRPALEVLRRSLPPGAAIVLLDAQGAVVAVSGAPAGEDERLPEPLAAAARAGRSAAFDPNASGLPAVVALVPLAADGAARTLRLDLPAHALAAQRRTLALLTPLVLGLTVAASIVVALFFRALLRPYETLLARARAAADGESGREAEREGGDELEFLVATFDRALAALGAPAGDLAPLAGSLGRELEGGFLLLDPQRRVTVATPAAVALLGAAAPAPGTPLGEAFPAERDLALELERALAADARVPRGTLRLEDGRALGFTAEPLRGEGGRPRGWLVVLADLTQHERQEARDRLADGLAQLGELSAGVAHELRNGLAALRGWIELARRRPPESAELAELLGEVDRESRELARVVDDFLAFARPGTRRDERCDLRAILGRVAGGSGGDEPRVELRLPAEPAILAGDPLLLERAIRNVVANAQLAEREAGSAGPVELSLETAPDAYRIRVADRGPGVPAALRARLFEPFATGRSEGVGLGLALARRIVVLHGGEIRIADREPRGTEVEIALPRVHSDTFGS